MAFNSALPYAGRNLVPFGYTSEKLRVTQSQEAGASERPGSGSQHSAALAMLGNRPRLLGAAPFPEKCGPAPQSDAPNFRAERHSGSLISVGNPIHDRADGVRVKRLRINRIMNTYAFDKRV